MYSLFFKKKKQISKTITKQPLILYLFIFVFVGFRVLGGFVGGSLWVLGFEIALWVYVQLLMFVAEKQKKKQNVLSWVL